MSGCSIVDVGNSADSAIRISSLGAITVSEYDKDAANSYSLNFEEKTTTTRFLCGSEEESFTYETDMWGF